MPRNWMRLTERNASYFSALGGDVRRDWGSFPLAYPYSTHDVRAGEAASVSLKNDAQIFFQDLS